MKPILTTIVPAYNSEAYIKRCLDSLNHPEIKTIIIDDGSTDKTPEIIDKYCKNHPNFQAIHTNNQGAATARQMGLNFITTPFFSFVDSDDIINTQNYINLCHAMQEQQIDVGNGRLTVYLPNISIPFNSRKWSKDIIDFAKDKKEFSNTTCSLLDKIFSSDSIDLFKEPSTQIVYEDLEFVYHALAKKRFMLHTNEPIYNYCMRGLKNNSTSAIGLNPIKSCGLAGLLSAITSMKKKFQSSKLLEEYEQEINAITIKLVYQRIYNVLTNKHIANKKQMAELIFQILNSYLPNWEQNIYFLEGFKDSELNDYLFFLATEILRKVYHIKITSSDQDYETLLTSYNQKLVLKR